MLANCFRFAPRDSVPGLIAKICKYLKDHPGWSEAELEEQIRQLVGQTGVASFNGRTGDIILTDKDVNNLKISSAYFAEGNETIENLNLVELYKQGIRFVFTNWNSVTSGYDKSFVLDYFSGSGNVVYYPIASASGGSSDSPVVSVNSMVGSVTISVVDVSESDSQNQFAKIFINEGEDYPIEPSYDSDRLGGNPPSYYASAKVVDDKLSKLNTAKVNKAGWTANKYLGTDGEGNVVVKDASNAEEASDKTLKNLGNPISDIIATSVANAYTGRWTQKIIDDNTVVYNGGMMCNDPAAYMVMLGETKLSSSSDAIGASSGTVNVRLVRIGNTWGNNDFTFTPDVDVEIFAPGGKIIRVDGTEAEATTGGFGDQIIHDTVNNNYIVIAEANVGNERVVFARVTSVEDGNTAPTMSFTQPTELTLTVDGVAYNIKNGLAAINQDYGSGISQYNGDISYVNNVFYWALTDNGKGWVILTSADGLNWEFNQYVIPDKCAENLYIEAAVSYYPNSKTFLIAGRTVSGTGCMVLTSKSGNRQHTELVPDCIIGSKPSIQAYGAGFFVGHNVTTRDDYELLYVRPTFPTFSNYNAIDIWRVNTWHGVSTQYATIRIGCNAAYYGYVGLGGSKTYANLLYCYGMDGNQFNKKGASFTFDAFEHNALKINSGAGSTLENAYYDKAKEVLLNGGSVLPDGGTTGQILVKASDADGDTEWSNAPTKLPNPYALTINGQSYDGSEPMEVSIVGSEGSSGFIGKMIASGNLVDDGTNTVFDIELPKSLREYNVLFVHITPGNSTAATATLSMGTGTVSGPNRILTSQSSTYRIGQFLIMRFNNNLGIVGGCWGAHYNTESFRLVNASDMHTIPDSNILRLTMGSAVEMNGKYKVYEVA